MKTFLLFCLGAVSLLGFTSCLTVNAKKVVEAPYMPEPVQKVQTAVEVENEFLIHFSKTDKPVIDGNFHEWANLDGIHVRRMVYGGTFNPENADGLFVYRSDGEYLYLYADITDDDARTNNYEISQAWRGDSIELFFGTDLSAHKFYKPTDVRVRIASNSKEDIFDVQANCFLHSFKKMARKEITIPSKKEAAAKKIWALAVSGFCFRSR